MFLDQSRLGEKPSLFGKMFKIAIDRVESYHSDLYHDAVLMSEHQGDFIWIVGQCGTHFFGAPVDLGDCKDLVGYVMTLMGGSAYQPSEKTRWYQGCTLMGTLEEVPQAETDQARADYFAREAQAENKTVEPIYC